eukprot:15472851-Alexandrium_andersonii.AAC.1
MPRPRRTKCPALWGRALRADVSPSKPGGKWRNRATRQGSPRPCGARPRAGGPRALWRGPRSTSMLASVGRRVMS